MKNYRMKLNTVLIIAMMGLVNLTAKAQQLNFSGVWQLDLNKSDFGNIPANAAVQKYTIQQNKSEISLIWITRNEKNEDITSTLKLPVPEGHDSTMLQASQRTRTTSIKFSEDGKSLTLIKSYSKPGNANETDYKITEVWKLVNDGKQLLIELTSPKYSIKAIYIKSVLSADVLN